MELKDQVCSKEQGAKLAELGVEAPALFWHTQDKTPTNPNIHEYGIPQESMPWRIFYGQRSTISTSDVHREYPAYTVAELGEMLPQYVYLKDVQHCPSSYRINEGYAKENNIPTGWCCTIDEEEDVPAEKVFTTEAQARAAMLIYLLENKLIEP